LTNETKRPHRTGKELKSCLAGVYFLNLLKIKNKGMKAVNIELNKSQFFKIINQLDDNDKFELYNELKKFLFLKRFNQLLRSTRTDELTMDEITNEVEKVRKERYEEGRQAI
jgi:hypothetical protein